MATALLAAVLAYKPVRERLARILPVDPDNPVHAFALVLAVLLVGTQLTSSAFISLSASAPLSLADVIAEQLSLLVLALAGVGLFIRRDFAQTASRLGLVVPAWWHVVLAVAAAGVFFVFGQAMTSLSHTLTPDVANQVDTTTQRLFAALDNPWGIAALALAPGICEEILFRGAIQPRLGILATALLFASVHTQYALSIDTLAVFVIAIGLGLIRKFTNTTTSSICHISYNLVTGIGIASSLMAGAIGIEALLIGVSVYAVWANRRRIAVAGEALTTRVGAQENNE
ncbi:MAG TPA: type II CAAX endopeptidase family protein [Candidatus Nitrosotalea sp.]|nr:type II CAAX endopeptidase family protein [Candidatus Nitrosotalea sp.]